MRFLGRALIGLALAALALGLAGYGGVRLVDAFQAQKQGGPRRAADERSFAVTVIDLEAQDVRPTLEAFGVIASARRLELRAARAGVLTDLAPGFLDGGSVHEGDLLFRVDPAIAESDLERARIALADAEAEVKDAARAVDLAGRDLEAAQEQRDLRVQALKRQEDLRSRGVGTDATVEAAQLALSAARQQVIAREQAQATAESRAARALIEERRTALAVADAARALAETELRAPFDGLVTEDAAVLGRRVAVNEKLGMLVDLARLEAEFRVSNGDYARLLDGEGRLSALPVVIRLDLGEIDAELPAHLVRAGAAAGDGRTGRILYARLEPEAAGLLREGDFVTVEVSEPVLSDVAVIPAGAATEDGRVLLVSDDDRLEERALRILRRDGDMLIVDRAPFGARIVAHRKPQLGPGVKISVVEPEPQDAPQASLPSGAGTARVAGAPASDGGPSVSGAGSLEMVELTPAQRDKLAQLADADPGIEDEARARLRSWLARGTAPRAVVERLEARGRAPSASGG